MAVEYGEKLKREGTTYELADVGQRFIALMIDVVILGIITGVLSILAREAGTGLGFMIGVGYEWYFMTRNKGQTPGKQLVGLRVMKIDGTPMSDADGVWRGVGRYISGVVFGIGYFWALADENNQTWHDKMAKTYVVRVRPDEYAVTE